MHCNCVGLTKLQTAQETRETMSSCSYCQVPANVGSQEIPTWQAQSRFAAKNIGKHNIFNVGKCWHCASFNAPKAFRSAISGSSTFDRADIHGSPRSIFHTSSAAHINKQKTPAHIVRYKLTNLASCTVCPCVKKVFLSQLNLPFVTGGAHTHTHTAKGVCTSLTPNCVIFFFDFKLPTPGKKMTAKGVRTKGALSTTLHVQCSTESKLNHIRF